MIKIVQAIPRTLLRCPATPASRTVAPHSSTSSFPSCPRSIHPPQTFSTAFLKRPRSITVNYIPKMSFSNADTGDKPADPYKDKNLQEVPLKEKVEGLVNFISNCKFGMMTTRIADTGMLTSRCMALAAKVSIQALPPQAPLAPSN